MNAAESETPVDQALEIKEPPPAAEDDHRQTEFSYGDGGVPIYVGIVWVLFIVTYLAVMSMVALPDFIAWMSA